MRCLNSLSLSLFLFHTEWVYLILWLGFMFDFCLWCWIWKFYFSLPTYTCFGVEINVLKFCVFLSFVLVEDEEKAECPCNKFCYVAGIICISKKWCELHLFPSFSLKDIYFLGDSMEVILGCRAELLVSKWPLL